jgi:hypothetical protein
MRVPEYLGGREDKSDRLKNHPVLTLKIDEESKEISFVHIISSLSKTAHRLLFAKEIYEINNFNPPFFRKSYADTRGIYLIEFCTGMLTVLLSNGDLLNESEYSQIVTNTQFGNITSFSKDELKMFNEYMNYE